MPPCSKGGTLKDGSAVKKVYPHPGTFACHANTGLSKCHPYRGGFPFPGTIVELDMLAQCGDVPLCPCCGWTGCRYPSPHYSHKLWGGHTLCYRWKHSLSTGLSHCFPERCVRAGMWVIWAHACFLSSLKGAHSFSIVSKSPADGLVCARMGSMWGCVPGRPGTEDILSGNPHHFGELSWSCLQTSLAWVWCPAGQGSHPFWCCPCWVLEYGLVLLLADLEGVYTVLWLSL